MTEAAIQQIEVSKISLGSRLRPVRRLQAEMLAANIKEAGRVKQAIQVRPDGKKGYLVVFGGHRLVAVKEILGWKTIPAIVRQTSKEEALLDEIDENLFRHELSQLDKSKFMGLRAELYVKLHPLTKKGGKNQHTKLLTDMMSFSKETAAKIGYNERTIRRHLQIFEGLREFISDAQTHDRLANSEHFQKQADLVALARLEPASRRDIIKGLLAEMPRWPSLKVALRAKQRRDVKLVLSPDEKLWNAFLRLTPAKQRAFAARVSDHLTRGQKLRAAE